MEWASRRVRPRGRTVLLLLFAAFAGGAGLAMKNGAKLIKPLLVVTCVALAVRLLMAEVSPLRAIFGG